MRKPAVAPKQPWNARLMFDSVKSVYKCIYQDENGTYVCNEKHEFVLPTKKCKRCGHKKRNGEMP